MKSHPKLRRYIREMLREELSRLEEMTTTGDVAGYNVPTAFTGNKKKNIRRKAQIAQQLGMKLTSRGKQDMARRADDL